MVLGLWAIFLIWRQLETRERNRLDSEQTLIEIEQRFWTIFEQTSVGVTLIRSKTGEYLRVSQRFADILGYSVAELQTMTYRDITHPDDLKMDENNLAKLLRGEMRGLKISKRYIHKDGSVIWVNLHGVALWGNNEQPDQHVTIVEDITERKMVESALRESEAKLKSIFRAAQIGIGLVGENRQLIWVNGHMCEMLGYTMEDLVGQNARFLYLTDEEYEYVGREKYEQIAEKGTGTVETRWLRKDGSVLEIILSSTPIDPSDRSVGVTFTALDISERVKAETKVKQRADQLELLRQASLEMTSALALKPVLDSILAQALQLLAAENAHIFLYENDILEFGAAKWADRTRRGQFAKLRQNGLSYAVARTGEKISVPNMREHALYQDWPLEGAIVSLPLKMSAKVVGVMNVALDLPYDFTEEELRILELLADQAAVAIDNARLHEQIQEHAQNLEFRVEERTAELTKLINLMAGREVRMAELKQVIRVLRKQLADAGITPIANDPLEEPF